MYKKSDDNYGFTIVELLVVIVVIGVLAAITVVSFSGIRQRANLATLVSDLKNASTQLETYKVTNNELYPSDLATADLKKSPNTNYDSYSLSGGNYCLQASNNGVIYHVSTSDKTPTSGACPLTCPTNFIIVPGSTTYGTSDFCVMKYEAKNVGGVATSQAAGAPWASISQNDAITESSEACLGCHLITEAEWLTIAQNVLNVGGNWYGGVVGTNYIYKGHNDDIPYEGLAASTDDADGYFGTEDTYISSPGQKRTLSLSNGEVIWDLSGNVNEWTSGQTTGNQPGTVGGGWALREWNAAMTFTDFNPSGPNPFPATTGIAGAINWDSTKGIGNLYSSRDDTTLRGFVRSGAWEHGGLGPAGVLALYLIYPPTNTVNFLGFRVAR